MPTNKVVLVLDRGEAETLAVSQPVTPETPCVCGATQPAHYCPVQAKAKAKLRDENDAWLGGEEQPSVVEGEQ